MALHDSPVAVIGGGGHGKVVVDLLLAHRCKIMGIIDTDPAKRDKAILGVPVLGGDDILEQTSPADVTLANGVGSVRIPTLRRDIYDRFCARGFSFRILVHPSAVIASDVILGAGSQIMAGAVLQPGVTIGADAVVNTRASVDHDCVIGDHVHIAPGVTLSGDVCIGAMSHVGAGATVIQGIRIGEACLVRAGAVVVSNIPDGATVGGVPARIR